MAKATTDDPAVEAFITAQKPPRRAELAALRRAIRDADTSIVEGIKWNAPSFRTREWFATCNLTGKEGLRLILHAGAKARETTVETIKSADKGGMLKWLGKDRAMVSFTDAKDIAAKRKPLQALVRAWIREI